MCFYLVVRENDWLYFYTVLTVNFHGLVGNEPPIVQTIRLELDIKIAFFFYSFSQSFKFIQLATKLIYCFCSNTYPLVGP